MTIIHGCHERVSPTPRLLQGCFSASLQAQKPINFPYLTGEVQAPMEAVEFTPVCIPNQLLDVSVNIDVKVSGATDCPECS